MPVIKATLVICVLPSAAIWGGSVVHCGRLRCQTGTDGVFNVVYLFGF